MRISVILCTYNRCQYLRKVLESVANSVLPERADWEVLVVDNNSSDQTQQVVEELVGGYPTHLRYIRESRQGKSYALNTGIRESRGEILAFLDDDVTVAPTWLRDLTGSLQNGEWVGAGGRTLLAEPFSPPLWLAMSGDHSLGGVLAAQFDLGDQARQLNKPPYGANMAYRKEMFEKYGMFRTDMGPSPDRLVPRPNEDTEFGRRVLNGGERIRYEPTAVVYHPVPKDRVRKDYFLSWFFDFGRAGIREIERRPDIWGIQRRYWTVAKISLAVLSVRTLRWMFCFQPAKRFFYKCFVWVTIGQIVEVHRHWGPTKAPNPGAGERMHVI